jgi:hypothetical protein
LVPLKAFSLDTFTLLTLDAVQPVGRAVLPSKSAQIIAPPQPPELELLELDELELDDELLELEELLDELLELELLDEELLELDELVLPEPPQAARVQVATMIGINLRMLVLPHLLL